MDDLCNDLLIEIWSRVPWKMAVRCKSISKRFLALFSQIHHHTLSKNMNTEEHQKEYDLNIVARRVLMLTFCSNLHLHNPHHQNQNHLSLSFMGGLEFDQNSCIVGFSNGLLLCKRSKLEGDYFVCNPLTKEWAQLPPVPLIPEHDGTQGPCEGFICELEENGVDDEDIVYLVNFRRDRFRVVLLVTSRTEVKFGAAIFSSERWEWETKLVLWDQRYGISVPVLYPDRAVEHNGRLFFREKSSLVVYDPFYEDDTCYPLRYPFLLEAQLGGRDITIQRHIHVGVSCGTLRMFYGIFLDFKHVRCPDISPSGMLTLWELEELEAVAEVREEYRWHLLYTTNGIIPMGEDYDANDAYTITAQAFHPHNGDVVFFLCFDQVCVYNFRTHTFSPSGYRADQFPEGFEIISLPLPLCPIPISQYK